MPFKPDYEVPPERRAYTFQAGLTGCLMLHGYLGSPASSRPLAQYLADHGITVHCPLLPGHGNFPNKLYKINRRAWFDEATEAFATINELCDEVFLMAHSMGTVLSAYLIGQSPEVNIRGVIFLAPATELPDRRLLAVSVARYVMPWLYPMRLKRLRPVATARLHEFDPNMNLEDLEIQAKLPELTKVPVGSIDEMRKVLAKSKGLWPQIIQPAIIFHGDQDDVVKVESTRKVFDALASEDKRLEIIPGGGHELMRPFDPVHSTVWSSILEFIQDRATLLEAMSNSSDIPENL